MIIKINGQLEVDQGRGVIYFHSRNTGHTVLRVCSLPKPIPDPLKPDVFLDITHMINCNWESKVDSQKKRESNNKEINYEDIYSNYNIRDIDK